MLIGMTYDLRDDYIAQGFTAEEAAEFDSLRTIEAIETALRKQGHEVERIGHIQALVKALAAGKRWDLVFNICEGVSGIGREAQVPALLEAYGIPYTFSSPEVMVTTMDKGMAKRIVRDHGVPTAGFAVLTCKEDIAKLDLPYPLFVKPIAEGTGKGVSAASRVENKKALEKMTLELLARFNQPVLAETFLSGREFTVGIIGAGTKAKVVGVLEVSLRDGAEAWCHSYHNKENCEELVDYVLAKDKDAKAAAEVALAAWRALECRDAGRIDIRFDGNGVPNFIEANPMAGLNPGHSDLPILAEQAGTSYDDLIAMIVKEAMPRIKGKAKIFKAA